MACHPVAFARSDLFRPRIAQPDVIFQQTHFERYGAHARLQRDPQQRRWHIDIARQLGQLLDRISARQQSARPGEAGVDAFVAALDGRIFGEDQHRGFGKMLQDHVFDRQDTRLEDEKFVLRSDQSREFVRIAQRDETRAGRLGAMLQFDDFLTDGLDQASDCCASCGKRDIELALDQTRACHLAKRRGCAPRIGRAGQHG